MTKSEIQRTLKQLAWPNGALVMASCLGLAFGASAKVVARSADYAVVAIIAAGLLIAWRFHAMRSMAALVLLAVTAFGMESPRVAQVASFLLPLNVIALLMVEEFTLALESIGYWSAFVGLQAVVVAATAQNTPAFWAWLNLGGKVWFLRITPLVGLAFIVGVAIVLFNFVKERRPLDAGLAWSLLPAFCAFNLTGPARMAYLAVAALAVTASVVETSYQLAYQDELTRLPGRRAFNQTVASLGDEYAIAMVDVDHFKKFNDTYGHDVGDQVLRMVASRLAAVGGEGRPFRCGGEEFAVVFPGKNSEQAMQHVEQLRRAIEDTTFNVRGPQRSKRRRDERRYCHSSRHLQNQRLGTSVTVSVGLAQPRSAGDDVHRVIEAADKALYAAKQRGRNRVVVATSGKRKTAATVR
jgi:diguanylate cyclase (GGDEF)-like protein